MPLGLTFYCYFGKHVKTLKCALSLAALARIWKSEGVTDNNRLSRTLDEVIVYPISALLYLVKNLLQVDFHLFVCFCSHVHAALKQRMKVQRSTVSRENKQSKTSKTHQKQHGSSAVQEIGQSVIIVYSPIEVTRNHPIPELDSPTAVRVKVKASSLNFATYLKIHGKYKEKFPLPFIPGWLRLCRHCRFCWLRCHQVQGGFEVPKGCDLVAAAGLPVAFGTSRLALVHRANLTSSQASPYFSSLPFIGSNSGGAEKVQFLKSLGVDHVVDLMNQNVTTSVKEFLKSRNLQGVDVLYDPVGGKLAKETMKLLNWGAQVEFASGEFPLIPANITLVERLDPYSHKDKHQNL
ncbi:hypothetical protein V6N11_045467 [Hibiscus sabdariffa]|uniref:Uncharacterized protein n=1 Tax=Hibiscus sabdariffa TaxID=183260 RepID=A0ABR2Q114_9ROSI